MSFISKVVGGGALLVTGAVALLITIVIADEENSDDLLHKIKDRINEVNVKGPITRDELEALRVELYRMVTDPAHSIITNNTAHKLMTNIDTALLGVKLVEE